MTPYYSEMLNLGLQFQDFVFDKLYGEGLPIISYSSKLYQTKYGENKAGFEIKYDRNFRKTGNFYIETAEKTKASLKDFYPSGILRDDNTWLYIIGDYETIYILSKRQLKILQKLNKFKEVKNTTSMGFLLPVTYAERFLVVKKIKTEPLEQK